VRIFLRLLSTFAGAAFAAFLVALYEAVGVVRALGEASERPPAVGALVVAGAGVLFPVAMATAAAIAPFAFLVEPEGSTTLAEDVATIRAARGSRLRAAVLTPVVVFALFVTTVGAAHIARSFAGVGAPAASGLSMGLATVTLMLATLGVTLSLLPTGWRLVARLATVSRLADPLVTGAAMIALAALLVAVGIRTGDTGGGGGLAGVGLFAVLARPELDLRPVGHMLVIAVVAYFAGAVARTQYAKVAAGAGALVIAALAGLCVRASGALGQSPDVSVGLERHAPLARVSIVGLRRVTDRDHDGHSASFGGADCDDRNPQVNPNAVDIPGNGLDEDCSGADTPVMVAQPVTPEAEPAPAADAKPKRTFNVVLITVDTLRYDLGFNGYSKPVSPNLDKLAAKGAVFERAYSLSSYTAKSLGPLLIGRYPSEALRDYDHFTTYYPANTFVAERIHAAGVRTIGGHCHYYFHWQTGYSQGFDVWDTSAIAPGMADNDSSITSERMSDLALKLLSRPDNVTPPPLAPTANGAGAGDGDGGAAGSEPRRFFAWFHYFDPHAQYVRHEGAPDFRSMPGGAPGRWIYDEEVWFTDKHIGRVIDHIQSQPWGADTAIIVTADHGEAFGDHGVRTHGHELYEPLVRVPLVVYLPGVAPRRVGTKRSHIDLAPTIMDLVGAPRAAPGELQGKSLVPDIYAASDAELEERDVYLDMPEGPMNDMRRGILMGPTPGLKLLHFGGRRYQLYDLATDPAETQDLSSDEAKLRAATERMQQMRAHIQEVAVGVRSR